MSVLVVVVAVGVGVVGVFGLRSCWGRVGGLWVGLFRCFGGAVRKSHARRGNPNLSGEVSQ